MIKLGILLLTFLWLPLASADSSGMYHPSVQPVSAPLTPAYEKNLLGVAIREGGTVMTITHVSRHDLEAINEVYEAKLAILNKEFSERPNPKSKENLNKYRTLVDQLDAERNRAIRQAHANAPKRRIMLPKNKAAIRGVFKRLAGKNIRVWSKRAAVAATIGAFAGAVAAETLGEESEDKNYVEYQDIDSGAID